MLDRKLRNGDKNGEYKECTVRFSAEELPTVFDVLDEVLEQLKASGRPLPPPHRRPRLIAIAIERLAGDWWGGDRQVDCGHRPPSRVDRVVQEIRRMTTAELQELHQQLEAIENDDEFIYDGTDEMPEPGLRGWEGTRPEGTTLRPA